MSSTKDILAHPDFNAATNNRILTEGFCELFTKDVLLCTAAASPPPRPHRRGRRKEVEGGDVAGFEERFVPDYSAGAYQQYLGHVEHIGRKPNGDLIDPAAPDAKKFLAPERVKIPTTVPSVGAVSILTGAPETDIVSANPGLPAAGPLPTSAHTTGLFVPGTTHHRTLEVGDRAGNKVVETKAQIAEQHGVSEHSIQRANPDLDHREPKPGEWVLILVH